VEGVGRRQFQRREEREENIRKGGVGDGEWPERREREREEGNGVGILRVVVITRDH